MAVIIAAISVWMAWRAFAQGKAVPLIAPHSIALPSPVEWIGNASLSFTINILCIITLAVMMLVINRRFNIIKTASGFFAAFFMFITCSTPQVTGMFSGSTLLALAVMAGVWLMFSIYNIRQCDRRVMLAFCLIGAGALTEYCFTFYIPAFFIAVAQMRVLRFKKLVAALLGLIAPAWIVWGIGVAPVPQLPNVVFTPPSMLLESPQLYPVLATVVWTTFTGFIMGLMNLIRLLGFNARDRAFNGLLLVLTAATGIFAVVNFTNVAFYVVLLNALVAFQVGHFFRFAASRRAYIPILANMAVYTALYCWNMSV